MPAIKRHSFSISSQGKCAIPLLYLYVFRLMVDKLGRKDQIITARELLEIWHRQIYNVPRVYDFHVLSEMCSYGLLHRINMQKYLFLGNKAHSKLKRLNTFFLW